MSLVKSVSKSSVTRKYLSSRCMNVFLANQSSNFYELYMDAYFPCWYMFTGHIFLNRPASSVWEKVCETENFLHQRCLQGSLEIPSMPWFLFCHCTLQYCIDLNLWNSPCLVRNISSVALLPYLTFINSLINQYLIFSNVNKLKVDLDFETLSNIF